MAGEGRLVVARAPLPAPRNSLRGAGHIPFPASGTSKGLAAERRSVLMYLKRAVPFRFFAAARGGE
jgi:hypothetical protein